MGQTVRPSDTVGPTDNLELAALHLAAQADRSRPLAVSPSELNAFVARDGARRARVRELMADTSSLTAKDFYRAAVVYQYGSDTTTARFAYEWAKSATLRDSSFVSARKEMAAAWDQYLVRQGKPQWYGTQIVKHGLAGQWTLYPVDSTRVTDAERLRLGVGTLAEKLRSVAILNRSGPPRLPLADRPLEPLTNPGSIGGTVYDSGSAPTFYPLRVPSHG